MPPEQVEEILKEQVQVSRSDPVPTMLANETSLKLFHLILAHDIVLH